MADVILPATGAAFQFAPDQLQQTINPWTWIFNPSGNQTGLFNLSVNLGHSTSPEKELAAISAASYGKQLGRIEDLLDVLVKELELARKFEPDSKEDDVINAYRVMRKEIAEAISKPEPSVRSVA